jgi:hypothetical protein
MPDWRLLCRNRYAFRPTVLRPTPYATNPPARSSANNRLPTCAHPSHVKWLGSKLDENTREITWVASVADRIRGTCLAIVVTSASNSSRGEPPASSAYGSHSAITRETRTNSSRYCCVFSLRISGVPIFSSTCYYRNPGIRPFNPRIIFCIPPLVIIFIIFCVCSNCLSN